MVSARGRVEKVGKVVFLLVPCKISGKLQSTGTWK